MSKPEPLANRASTLTAVHANGNGHRVPLSRNHPNDPAKRREAVVSTDTARAAVTTLLEFLGENPLREGLVDTPKRFVQALQELTRGYAEDAAVILGRVFTEDYDEMVLVRSIPFVSLCEHHLLPVQGHASVAYLPNGRVVGLSKLSRLVQLYARRLQSQERMTTEIARALEEHLAPNGVAIYVRAQHACMALRGVRTPATMITSAFRGEFREPAHRAEFLQATHADHTGD